MQSTQEIKDAMAAWLRLLAVAVICFVVGLVFAGMSGCNAVSGLGRDMTQTSDMVYGGIKAYYSQIRGRDRKPDTMMTQREWDAKYIK